MNSLRNTPPRRTNVFADPQVRLYAPFGIAVVLAMLVIAFLALQGNGQPQPLGKQDQQIAGQPAAQPSVAPQPTSQAMPTSVPDTIQAFFAPDGALATTFSPLACNAIGTYPGDWVLCDIDGPQNVWVKRTDVPNITIHGPSYVETIVSAPDPPVAPAPIVWQEAPAPAAQPVSIPSALDISAENLAEIANRTDQASGGGIQPVPTFAPGQVLPTAVVKPVLPYDPNDPAAVETWNRALANSGVNVEATQVAQAAVACASDYTGGSCR